MSSCTETSSSVTTISFNPKAEPRSIFDTGIIKNVKLVRLESDSCIVGKIDKIICNDSLLYIMDRFISKEVYIFTKEGRFVNKISKQGHGKHEYTQLWDIFYDKEKNALCLLSRCDMKIISFSPDGKKVLGENMLSKMFSQIIQTEDGYIGYMGNSCLNPSLPYNIWTMDKSFNVLDGFVQIAQQLKDHCYDGVNAMSVYRDKIYFKPEYVNTIYQIKDGEISERYQLDFGDKTFPELSILSYNDEAEWSRLRIEKVSNVFNYLETNDYLLMDFIIDGHFRMGVYNKHDQTSEITEIDCYQDKYIFSFGQIKGMDQSAIYSVVDYEGVYDIWLGHNKYCNYEELYPKQVNNLRRLFPKLEEDGNPFIAVYEIE